MRLCDCARGGGGSCEWRVTGETCDRCVVSAGGIKTQLGRGLSRWRWLCTDGHLGFSKSSHVSPCSGLDRSVAMLD